MPKGAIADPAIPLAKDALPGLVSNMTSNAMSNVIDKLGRQIAVKGVVRAGRGFTLFISNGDLDDIIKILEVLEKSGLLIDGASETAKL